MVRGTVRVAETDLHYVEAGSGDPVLLLHGVNCGGEGWAESLRRLAPLGRIVAPDLRGWGDTPPPPGFRYEIDDLVRFTLQTMDALAIRRAAVVGWSFGGCLAAHLAAAAPERVSRLALVAPGGLADDVHWSYRAMCIPGIGEWMMRPTQTNIQAGLRAVTVDSDRLPPTFIEYLLRIARNPWFGRTTLRWLRHSRVWMVGARRISVAERLQAIRCPTLVVWGAADPLVPPSHAAIAAERIPGARVELLPETGHIPHLEQPERFHALLAQFLGETVPASAAN